MARQYKRPESVLVVIYTLAGEALLLERTRPPGFWQSVTGSLRWGESALAAARRELFEETGLQMASHLVDARQTRRFPILPPWRDRYHPLTTHNTEHWFYLPLVGRRLIRLSPREHRRCRWMPLTRAAGFATSWTNREALAWLAAGGAGSLQSGRQVIHQSCG